MEWIHRSKKIWNMMENEHGRIDLLTQEQIVWCDEFCSFDWFVKNDGKVYSKNDQIYFNERKLIVLFLVEFGRCEYFDCSCCDFLKSLKGSPKIVDGNFTCSFCDSLESLEGAPESISGNFDCALCDSLRSLEGASKSVGGFFECSSCFLLKSLKGAPKNVGEYFDCSSCKLLKSLEGAPEKVDGNFNCFYCNSLESLEGASENVSGYFTCSDCHSLESIDGLKNTKNVKKIICNDCPKLKKYDPILSDMKMFRKWQNSEYTADEFMKEWSGYFDAQKYGI